jgi:UDPglucose 6-dehydrogenase
MRATVIGLGKLGLPFAALIARAGHRVVGLDLNRARLQGIEAFEIESEPQVFELVKSELNHNLSVTSDWNLALSNSEISFIIVPTPSGADGQFKNDFVSEAICQILESIKTPNHIICVVSTVMPGTCEKVFMPIIQNHVNSRDLNIQLAYSPEFIALGTIVKNMETPDLILIGEKQRWVGDKLVELLSSVSKNSPKICRMSLGSAELAKISINTFVTSKISYANMIAEIADSVEGINKFDVLEAVGSDSRVGGKYLKPGLGFGGPCFPRDNRALGALANSLGINAELAEATEKVNLRQPHIQVEKIINKIGKKSKKVLFLGLSYKPGSYVIEESQALMIATLLASKSHIVHVHDPLAVLSSQLLSETGLLQVDKIDVTDTYQYVVLAVDWPEYEFIKSTVEGERLLQIF